MSKDDATLRGRFDEGTTVGRFTLFEPTALGETEGVVVYNAGQLPPDELAQITQRATFGSFKVVALHEASDGLFHLANASGSVLCLGRDITADERKFILANILT